MASESPYVESAQESTASAEAASRSGKYTNLYQDRLDRAKCQARVLRLCFSWVAAARRNYPSTLPARMMEIGTSPTLVSSTQSWSFCLPKLGILSLAELHML